MNRIILTLLSFVAVTACHAQTRQTDEFTTKNGKKVTITCIKHASMAIDYNGMQIQVDPVGLYLTPHTDYSEFPKADIILVTHEHKDHFDREAIAQLRTHSTAIYTNQAVYELFHNGMPLRNGDSIAYAADITIKAVPAYNVTEGRQQFHPRGRDNGYVLTLDGLRIYIAGDTEDIPEMAELKDIDIAFLPCNQPYTMTTDQLVRAAQVIRPKVLFPYHYNDTPVRKVVMQLVGTGIDVRIRNYQ
jgi:L-ascorbate metabolism protein UlaG (beta-lactamase superfamily)